MEVEDIMIAEGFLTWDDVYGDGSNIEERKFSKLNRDQKNYLKEIVSAVVWSFWDLHHLIPVGTEIISIKKQVRGRFAEDCRIRIKDDQTFREYLNSQIISAINKQLKKENKNRFKVSLKISNKIVDTATIECKQESVKSQPKEKMNLPF